MIIKKAAISCVAICLLLASCKKDTGIGERLDFDNFLAENILVTLNPNGNTPLAALAQFRTSKAVRVSLTVQGANPLSHTFEGYNRTHDIPVLGLYPGITNNVELTITDEDGNWAQTTLLIKTDSLPAFFPEITIDENTPLKQEGWNLCDFGYGKGTTFGSVPFIFDQDGIIRWYLDLTQFSDLIVPIQQRANGNLLLGFEEKIYEYSMLGDVVKTYDIPGYHQHHDIIVKPNGNLVVAVSKTSLGTVEDQILEIDPSGNTVNEWDMRKLLDVDREDLVDDQVDWLHMNGIWYSEDDDCLIVSGRNQGIVKVTSDHQVKWILAPHQGWGKAGIDGNSYETSDFLLTAIDGSGNAYPNDIQTGTQSGTSFDWTWGQHAPMLLPNGDIFVFDNGFNRNFIQNNTTYSRAVEYRVDEANMTVQQIWQYGKSRGTAIQSPIISDVDLLENTNRLMTSGIIFSNQQSKIIEVTYPDKTVAFEATLQFKNQFASGNLAWGDFDLCYRSERLNIYGP